MSTSFDEIRDLFLSKIIDYDFASLDETDINSIFDKYLISAIPKFRYCRKNLYDRDNMTRVFNEALSDTEKDILSTLCVIQWMETQINNIEEFRNHLSTKDFNIFSPANHLKEIRSTKKELENKVDSQMNYYLFDIKSSEVGVSD
jgi:hypothetical protein